MILNFTVENWMSFRNKASFTMIASRERQHRDRVPRVESQHVSILPIAALYGGNASGKTNFFEALSFMKKFVVKGTQPDNLISVEPFLLDNSGADTPSRFAIVLLIDEAIYEFSFSVTRKAVIEEKLVHIGKTRERILYDRRDGEPNFDNALTDDKFLQFAFRGTRDNQLFITNSVSQKVDTFRPVYNWFKDTLRLVAPDSRFEAFEQFLDTNHTVYSIMGDLLSQLDTGISRLGQEDISFEKAQLPESLKEKLRSEIKEGMAARVIGETSLIISRHDGELAAKKLVSFHPTADGSEVSFEVNQESDGSRRILDLLPAFLDVSISGSKKVYIVDEVDRSLHTLMTRRLIEAYLSTCSVDSRAQVLFTTHDVLLMDQQLLRRDEMWVVERGSSGISDLWSFNEYKDVRYDKDIRKSYLHGRLGGIPHILVKGALISPSPGMESEGMTHDGKEKNI